MLDDTFHLERASVFVFWPDRHCSLRLKSGTGLTVTGFDRIGKIAFCAQ